jgi:TPR repeat protein
MLRPDPSQQPTPETQPAARPPDVPVLSPEARERALRLVKKGNEQLAEGAIAQARLLYERAAEAGSALGAMALAATYDPAELQRLGALGLKADRDAARRWYERARQLGAVEAEERLRRLGAN